MDDTKAWVLSIKKLQVYTDYALLVIPVHLGAAS
jgi:hypothetical protein